MWASRGAKIHKIGGNIKNRLDIAHMSLYLHKLPVVPIMVIYEFME